MTRYSPDPWKSEIDDFLSRLVKRCNDRAKARMRRSGIEGVEFVETYLLEDGGSLQAYAGFEGGVHVIEINFGTIFLLWDFFDQMLSHPLNFRHVGRANQETVRNNYDVRRQTIDLSNFAQRRWQPIDVDRANYAATLALAAIDFLFHHELGHIFNGHVGLIRAHGIGTARLPETGGISIPALTDLDRQTLEFDADCFAMDESLLALASSRRATGQKLYTLLCAVYSLYKVFAGATDAQSVGDLLRLDHPPAHIRLRLVLGRCIEWMRRYRPVAMPDFGKLVVGVKTDCEEGFARISGEAFDFDNIMGDNNLTSDLIDALQRNWMELRPRLVTFSFDPRLPPSAKPL